MDDVKELPMRDLTEGEQPDFPVGTLRLGEAEHGCCHQVAIRRLNIFERGDGSRLQTWDLVAEFTDASDAEVCLRAFEQCLGIGGS